RRAATLVELPGLPDPVGDGGARAVDRARRDAVSVHATRGQGRRGGRPDDGAGGDQRRRQRRPGPAWRPPHRAADDPRADPVGPARRGAGGLSARVAAVPGANRGIGRAIAAALAAGGFTVAASARDPASLADTVAEAAKAGGTVVPL